MWSKWTWYDEGNGLCYTGKSCTDLVKVKVDNAILIWNANYHVYVVTNGNNKHVSTKIKILKF